MRLFIFLIGIPQYRCEAPLCYINAALRNAAGPPARVASDPQGLETVPTDCSAKIINLELLNGRGSPLWPFGNGKDAVDGVGDVDNVFSAYGTKKNWNFP